MDVYPNKRMIIFVCMYISSKVGDSLSQGTTSSVTQIAETNSPSTSDTIRSSPATVPNTRSTDGGTSRDTTTDTSTPSTSSSSARDTVYTTYEPATGSTSISSTTSWDVNDTQTLTTDFTQSLTNPTGLFTDLTQFETDTRESPTDPVQTSVRTEYGDKEPNPAVIGGTVAAGVVVIVIVIVAVVVTTKRKKSKSKNDGIERGTQDNNVVIQTRGNPERTNMQSVTSENYYDSASLVDGGSHLTVTEMGYDTFRSPDTASSEGIELLDNPNYSSVDKDKSQGHHPRLTDGGPKGFDNLNYGVIVGENRGYDFSTNSLNNPSYEVFDGDEVQGPGQNTEAFRTVINRITDGEDTQMVENENYEAFNPYYNTTK